MPQTSQPWPAAPPPAQALPAGASLPAVLVVVTALAAADTATALHRSTSLLLTAVATALAVPWVLAICWGQPRRPRGPRFRLQAAEVVAVALVAVCLAAKWQVLLASPAPATRGFVASYRTYTAGLYAVAALGLLARERRFGRFVAAVSNHPARLTLLTFSLAALMGAFLLTLPQSLRNMAEADFVDALFMATSAVCVTGLAVIDVGRTYTPFGQAVLLLLIQLGGLGLMALSAFLTIAAGRRLRLRSSAALAETLDAVSLASIRRVVLTIVVSTLLLEGAGAVLLFAAFGRHPEVGLGPESDHLLSGPGSRVWAAVFHSVSAFCNAGFSLFPRSLEPLVGDVPVNLVVMALIVVGGLGFPVLDELARLAVARMRGARPARLSLHARTVLVVSGALVGVLAVSILLLERDQAMGELGPGGRILAALFQSVTARTAGFNTLDISALRPPTLVLFCLAMFVGASPGSTGGGVKTTALAALFALLRSVITGAPTPRLFDRTLPEATVRRAMAVASLSALLVAVFTFALLLLERQDPLPLLVETVSAFGTVGLSAGITGELSTAGRLLIALLMLLGRVGPLTLAFALARRTAPVRLRLPEERLAIG